MKFRNFALGFVFVVTAPAAFAATELGQGRLFLGSTQTKPTELNTELAAQGLKEVTLNNSFGVEITFPTFGFMQTGLRYTYHLIGQDENPADANTDYKAELVQNTMMGVARIPFFKSDVVYADVFAGVGAAMNSSYTIKTAGQDGKLEHGASPVAAAGASLSLGYKQYYFMMEAGYEMNKLDKFTSSGNINSNVTAMDLSGSYFLIGFMFDGIPIFKK